MFRLLIMLFSAGRLSLLLRRYRKILTDNVVRTDAAEEKQKFTYGICPTVVNRMVILTTQVDLCTRSDSSARYGKDPTEITRHFF